MNIFSTDEEVLAYIQLAKEAELTALEFDFPVFCVVSAALVRAGAQIIYTQSRRTRIVFHGVEIREKNVNPK